MATTAAATAMASSFSLTSIHHTTLQCMHTEPRIQQHTKLLKVGLLSSSHHHTISSFSFCKTIKPVCANWILLRSKVLKISAAVAQDESSVEEEVAVEKEGDSGVKEEVNAKLYFGNLPYNCDSAQLAGIIQEYASPELIEVLYDRETGRSRGFAFVTMSSIEDCNAVIENLAGREFGGRPLRVNFSDKPKPKEPFYPETAYKLFVGGLAWSVTSEALTQVFQEYGNVVGARVLYDGESGRSRGYGFVSYASEAEMQTALEALNGVEIEGRAIRVSIAEGKKR